MRGGFWIWVGSLSVILSRDEREGVVCASGESGEFMRYGTRRRPRLFT
jgi:hypothetical protein